MPTPTEQLLSRTIYDTDGITSDWDFSFADGYLDASHVKAYTLNTTGTKTQLTSFTLSGEFQLHTSSVLPSGLQLVIYRDTPKDAPLVDFSDGNNFTEVSLDITARQAIMVAAESSDAVTTSNIQDAIDASVAAAASAASALATKNSIIADATASATSAATTAALTAANIAVAASTASAWTAANTAEAHAGEAQGQANASEASAQAALASKASAQAAQVEATAQAAQAASSVNQAAASAISAGQSASASSNSASQAMGYRNAAVAAWAASTAPAEQLASIIQSLHFGTVVKAIIDDTSRHTDGGAWRKRCQDKSWYTEALGGDRWIGQQASIAAAWTAAGSAVGAVFQATATAGPLTAGKYYAATSSTTAVEVFRGIGREYPAAVAWVAESGRVIGYDLTQPGCPMWMVFVGGSNFYTAGSGKSSVAARDGVLLVGVVNALTTCEFVADRGRYYLSSGGGYLSTNIAARNSTAGYTATLPAIVNSTINDVAITTLDTALTDPATGLPVPTILVATTGGASVIRDNGTVESTVSSSTVSKVWIDDKYFRAIAQTRLACATPIGTTLPAGGASHLNSSWTSLVYYELSIPAIALIPTAVSCVIPKAIGSSVMLTQVKENPATPAKGMVNYVTNAHNTGWMVGDIRGAFLADTVAETITASGELVVNGGFDTDTNWTKTGTVISGGVLAFDGTTSVTNGTAIATPAVAIVPVVGRSYVISYDVTTSISLGAVSVNLGGVLGTARQAAGSYRETLTVISAATLNVSARSNDGVRTGAIDNISVKLAEPERSVKNKGLVINGSLTKTAVASGAGLVAYSGFSASNYLEQPYNADLDFGTGDFCYMGWINMSSLTSAQCLFDRGGSGSGRICLTISSTLWYVSVSATSANATATGVVPPSGLSFIVFYREAGTLKLSVNGVQVYSVSNTANVSNTSAAQRFGQDYTTSASMLGTMALWRISATAPSADQIAHIYRTELPLFQANAQCTLAGTSSTVTALAYDEVTDELHVGTNWGRSEFKDLLRVASETTTTGSITSLAAHGGVILTGGTSAKVYAPAMYLRDELRRKDAARKALGRIPVFFDYTATASQTVFVVPKGFTIKAVYKAGVMVREATTGVYWTRSTDGFQEYATMSVAATVGDWFSIMVTRS